MKPLQERSMWVGYLVKTLTSQKAQVQIMQNVHLSATRRFLAMIQWVVQGMVLFVCSPIIILFATPVSAFPLIARQRREGTWTYSFSEFSDFQTRAKLLFVIVLMAALITELILFLR